MSRFHLACILGIFFCVSTNNVQGLEAEGIIGGDLAEEGAFKYQVALYRRDSDGLVFNCGGAIIADKFVLTAAHCFHIKGLFNFRNVPYNVIAGTIDLRNFKKWTVNVPVEKVYVHKNYGPYSTNFDIAVIKLKSGLGVGRNSHLNVVELPDKADDTYEGLTATVSGFGTSKIRFETDSSRGNATIVKKESDYKLKSLQVKVLSFTECENMMGMSPRQICGHVEQRGGKQEAVCNGDSGGPLVYKNTIIGIVKGGEYLCREHLQPTVYVKVMDNKQFILNIINDHPDADAVIHDVPTI